MYFEFFEDTINIVVKASISCLCCKFRAPDAGLLDVSLPKRR